MPRLGGGTIVQLPCTGTFGTCWLQNWHRRWRVDWSWIDYCNAMLLGAPSYRIKKFLRMLHWLPVQQRIDYKVALLTFKVHNTSTLAYLRRLIQDQQLGHNLWSATTTLCQPSKTKTFAKHAFQCSAPAVWNSLLKTVLSSDSVTFFKFRLKTFLFSKAFSLSSAN